MKTVKTFKYLGSMFDANGEAEKDVNNRVKIAWSKWKENYWGDMRQEHTNKVETQSVHDGYKTGHGAECWAVRKKEERKLRTTEMHLLRWARGKTRLDHVRNVDIWKEAHVYPMTEFLSENRLRWFGHEKAR